LVVDGCPVGFVLFCPRFVLLFLCCVVFCDGCWCGMMVIAGMVIIFMSQWVRMFFVNVISICAMHKSRYRWHWVVVVAVVVTTG
jgi:hypothetical protein